MPTFDFMIPKSEFYINIQGFSVTEVNKSSSEFDNAAFYVLNKNSIPIYFYSLELDGVSFRNDTIRRTNNIYSQFNSQEISDGYLIKEYNLYYNDFLIGQFYLRSVETYMDGSYSVIQPFESVGFDVRYSVKNIGVLGNHYYGKSGKKIGKVDVNLNVKYLRNLTNKQDTIIQPIMVTLNLVNSGYVAMEKQNAESLLLPQIIK